MVQLPSASTATYSFLVLSLKSFSWESIGRPTREWPEHGIVVFAWTTEHEDLKRVGSPQLNLKLAATPRTVRWSD
jgi:hypothetical protein